MVLKCIQISIYKYAVHYFFLWLKATTLMTNIVKRFLTSIASPLGIASTFIMSRIDLLMSNV